MPSLSVVGVSMPSLSVVGVSMPSLSVVGVSMPSLSVVGVSMPSLSVVGVSMPSLSVVGVSMPSLSVSGSSSSASFSFINAEPRVKDAIPAGTSLSGTKIAPPQTREKQSSSDKKTLATDFVIIHLAPRLITILADGIYGDMPQIVAPNNRNPLQSYEICAEGAYPSDCFVHAGTAPSAHISLNFLAHRFGMPRVAHCLRHRLPAVVSGRPAGQHPLSYNAPQPNCRSP